jgi:Zn-dependent protease
VTWDLTARRRRPWSNPNTRPSPIFLAFVATALVAGVFTWRDDGSPSRGADFAAFVLVVALWVVSLGLHEFGHAYAAYRAGDHSVEAAGYLTLNPVRYAHPVLSIVLPLLFIVQGGIGLPGGAVYLHRHSFRSKASQSMAAAAGPLANVAFAALTLWLVHSHDILALRGDGSVGFADHGRFWAALGFLGLLQVSAALLNLLPVPGLDGWSIIEPYLNPETVRGAEPVKPWGMIGVIVLLQINQFNRWFFNLVYTLFEWSGVDRSVASLGREVFRFWQKFPV